MLVPDSYVDDDAQESKCRWYGLKDEGKNLWSLFHDNIGDTGSEHVWSIVPHHVTDAQACTSVGQAENE